MARSSEKNTLISIGLTSYNAIDTIGRAVESALAQDWPNLEVIVVDDVSSDGSWEYLQEIARQDARVRVIRHQQNTGVGEARQTILDAARGEFLAYFDDDDDNLPDRLTAQYERIVTYEARTGAELVYCYSDRNVVKSGQKDMDHVGYAIGRRAPEPHGNMVADYLLAIGAEPEYAWGLAGSCTLMARRRTYVAAKGFDSAFRRCAEIDLAIRAAFLGAHFIAVDRPLITQYKTASADKAGTKPLHYTLMLRDKHRDYLAGRRLYHASRLLAYSKFYGNKKKIWRSRAYRALAFAAAPHLLRARIKDRLAAASRLPPPERPRV